MLIVLILPMVIYVVVCVIRAVIRGVSPGPWLLQRSGLLPGLGINTPI
jgi:hypothetical protein